MCGSKFSDKTHFVKHEKLHAPWGKVYSKGFESAVEGNSHNLTKILERGKKLKDDADKEFKKTKHGKADRFVYSIFKLPILIFTTLFAFAIGKVYEGKGTGRRDLQHNDKQETGKFLKTYYAKCRNDGTRLAIHKFWTGLTSDQSALYELAKLAALGHWNTINENNGERVFEKLNWSRNTLATLGVYLIYCEFEMYKGLVANDAMSFRLIDLGKNPEPIIVQVRDEMTVGDLKEQLKDVDNSAQVIFRGQESLQPTYRKRKRSSSVY